MSDKLESILLLVSIVTFIGALLYLRMRAGPGRAWHLVRRFFAELVKEYGPPGFDPFEKVTPAMLVGVVLIMGLLFVLKWYKQTGSPLAQEIDAIYEIVFGFLFLGVVGLFVIRKVLRSLDDDDDDAKQ